MARQVLRSTALVVIAVIAGQSLAGPTAAEAGDAASVVFTDTPPEIEAMADWALDLFEQAEMELPAVEIRYHGDDRNGCDGHQGLHRPTGNSSIVEICTSVVEWSTQVVVLHELAHAWSEHTATTERRAAFQELRGYDHWLNYDEAMWHENGTEQAAEIIVWGLVDRPMAMSRITQNSCDELETGYLTLTGQAPLHGLRDLCR